MLPMIFWGFEYVHPDHTGYYSISTLNRMLNAKNYNMTSAYAFQWHNPTMKNFIANGILYPALYLTGGRLCDELALSFSVKS